LALDHHYSTVIAVHLRGRGHDVVAAIERDWHTLDDGELLDACRAESRALLTNNVADFAVIARRLAADSQAHHGLVFTSDGTLPRTLHTIGRYVDLLDALMQANPTEHALVDRIEWL
jgi:hypothetical protein